MKNNDIKDSDSNVTPLNNHRGQGSLTRDFGTLLPVLQQSFAELSASDSEWVDLAKLGHKLKRIAPGFEPLHFGFYKLAALLEASGFVEIRVDHSVAPPRKFGRLVPSVAPIAASQPMYTEMTLKGALRIGPRPPVRSHTSPPRLSLWAYFPSNSAQGEGEPCRYNLRLRPMPSPEGWVAAINALEKKTLEEDWTFKEGKDPRNPYPILQSYLWWTFFRLFKEKKICVSDRYAAFNTGLVDPRFEPIYAWFERNTVPGKQPFYFREFCTAGEGLLGKRLVATFNPLPSPPHYFDDPKNLFYDVNAPEPSVSWEHVIGDNVFRLPRALIEDNCPQGFVLRDPTNMSEAEQSSYAAEFKSALKSDSRKYRSLMNRMADALKVALKRTRWNFKTAIPQYFPTRNQMSLLLPLGLVQDDSADVALVVEKTGSGAYLGHTILPLDWAYNNARLICRPNSDWLVPQKIPQTTVLAPQAEPGIDTAEGQDETVPPTR